MLRKLYIEVIGYMFYLIIILINCSLKVEVKGAENYYNLKKERKNMIFIFWHQATFIPLYLYRNTCACILTMKSLRGEILAKAGELLGYQVIRLEAVDDAAGVRQMIKLVKQGFDANIAVDGPLGPRQKMKPGAVYLAKKLHYPLLPVSSNAEKKIVFSRRWDKYFVPLPFSRVEVVFGRAIYPQEGTIEEIREKCEQALMKL